MGLRCDRVIQLRSITQLRTAPDGVSVYGNQAGCAQVEVMVYEPEFWEILGPRLLREDVEWLEPLRSLVSRIIVFGCRDTGEADSSCREAYALLRILDASSAVVVDKEAEHINNARCWFRKTRAQYPALFGSFDVVFAASDMTQKRDELGHNRFDLAYCSGVLFYMRSDAGALQAAVNTMARVVKPGGWVTAAEDEGLDSYFERAGLEKATGLDNAPDYAYCYQKPATIQAR